MWIRTVLTILAKVGATIMIVLIDGADVDGTVLMSEKAMGLMKTGLEANLGEQTPMMITNGIGKGEGEDMTAIHTRPPHLSRDIRRSSHRQHQNLHENRLRRRHLKIYLAPLRRHPYPRWTNILSPRTIRD